MEHYGSGKFTERDDLFLISELAAGLGVDAYLVGGCLRDHILGRENNDLDFAISGAWKELPAAFAERLPGSFFWLNEKRRQARIVRKGGQGTKVYDFAPLCGASIEDDLARRDFTINSLAISLCGDGAEIIDPLLGRDDLRMGLIRACGRKSFDDDPLRLLRAIRFAAELGFAIEEKTWDSICMKSSLLQQVAGERIKDELFRTLAFPGCGASLKRLWESGLWAEIYPAPYAETMEGHIACADEAERLCSEMGHLFPEGRERLAVYLNREVEGGVSTLPLLKLAAFIGVDGEGKTAPLVERLRLGKEAGRMIDLLCRDEKESFRILDRNSSERPFYRFFRDREPAGPGMLIIAGACSVISGPCFSRLLGFYIKRYDPQEGDLFLSGAEVMEILSVPPGKAVGEAMERLRKAEGSGFVSSREEARVFIKNLLTKEEAMR